MSELFIELFSEEIPANLQISARNQIEKLLSENLSSLNPSFEELGKNGVDALQLKYFPQLSEIVHIHTAGNSPAMSDAASITLLSSSSCPVRLFKTHNGFC